MPRYREFYEKYKDQMDIFIIYQLEAHFVEKNDAGEIVGGWPIVKQYNFPQTKTNDERIAMVDRFRDEFGNIPILVDTATNEFSQAYNTWPDGAMIFKNGKIIYSACVNHDGTRSDWVREITQIINA